MHSRFSKLTLAAVAAALALPAVAGASSVTYVDGGNVWLASPDGAVKRQLTQDGSAQSSYHLPSADDQGAITAFKGGNSSSKLIAVIEPDGSATPNVMPWQITSWPNIGPNSAHVNPTSTQVAYTYFKNHGPYSGYPNGGFEQRLAVVPARAPGSPTSPMVDIGGGWDAPTWIDGKLVVARGGALHLETQPLQFTQFLAFDPPDPANPSRRLSILRGEVSRDKARYLLHARDWNGVEGLFLAAHTGAFPGGTVTGGCWVPVAAGLDNVWGLSPDGTQVTWADQNGVHVGTLDPGSSTAQGLCTGQRTTLSGSGIEPTFGAASAALPEPEPQPQPEPPPPPALPPATPPAGPPAVAPSAAPSGSPAPAAAAPAPRVRLASDGKPAAPTTGASALDLTVPAALKAATLGRGLRVAARAPGPGTVTARLGSGRRTLGTARLVVRKAGRVQLRLRLTKSGRKALRRMRGKRASLTVTFTPRRGGGKLTSTARVTLR